MFRKNDGDKDLFETLQISKEIRVELQRKKFITRKTTFWYNEKQSSIFSAQ